LLKQASRIWLRQSKPLAHQYVCFRKSFILESVEQNSTIDISADSDFVLYLNGREVGRGQFSDYPQRKTFTRFNVGPMLKRGRNVLAILAYYRGEDFSEHRAGKPGLVAALCSGSRVICTDETWRAAQHPAFACGPMPRVTFQMGFTTLFDARKDFLWHLPGFQDKDWRGAEVQSKATDGFWREILPRPVPPLVIEEPVEVAVVMQGAFFRSGEKESVARTMAADAILVRSPAMVYANKKLQARGPYCGPPLSPSYFLRRRGGEGLLLNPLRKPATGTFLIIDLGREEVGLLDLHLEAPAGAVLDIAHGEHLDEGRVRMAVGGRNFADRYICRKGDNRFMLPFRRIGGRYLQVHLWGFSSAIRLRYLGLRPVRLAVEPAGDFVSEDPMADRMYAIGRRTLTLCMHEHYEDCPWREQSLYAYDSRNQALCGYYVFGNYDFAAASFDLLGRGIRDDGLLELCAPARVSITIPIFSLVWIAALAEHWLYSGSNTLFLRFSDQAASMLEKVLARRDTRTDLYYVPDSPEMWHFYEWTGGLASKLGNDTRKRQVHAAYNLYLHEALGSYAWMLGLSSDQKAAANVRRIRNALGKSIHAAFWNEKHGTYATMLPVGRSSNAHDLIQVLALHEGIVPRSKEKRLLAVVQDQRLPGMTLSSLLYLVRALMEKTPQSRRFVSRIISKYWEPMVLAGATSFWETQYGGADFDGAGSLCHGWSALPVYYYQAHVLGVRPLEPGFARFMISPFADRFFTARGNIPTPFGPISIDWRRSDWGLIVTSRGPKELRPVLRPLPETPVSRATYNGRLVKV